VLSPYRRLSWFCRYTTGDSRFAKICAYLWTGRNKPQLRAAKKAAIIGLPSAPSLEVVSSINHDEVGIPNSRSGVRFRQLQATVKPQELLKRLPLRIVWKPGIAFKGFDRGHRNPHIISHLAERQPLFIAFDVDMVAQCFEGGRD
jgi:hypothetical protein